MMIKVLLYCYATGTFSSRKMARRLYEDVAVRVLAAGNFPAHRTIAEFRQRHRQEFEKLFVKVVQIAREAGLVKLGRVAVDGSKVKANASKHKAMRSYGRMVQEQRRLEAEISELLDQAQQLDEAEDELYGKENWGEELPEELRRREDRLEKIREAKGRVEERQAEADRERGRTPGDGRKSAGGGRNFKRDFGVPDEKAQENFTDPESRIMKSSGSFEQCYNAQLAVDEETQIIVAAGVTNNAADNGQLLKMVDEVEQNMGRRPKQVVADAGYKSEENFKGLQQRDIDGYIALSRQGSNPVQSNRYPATAAMYSKLSSEQGRAVYRRRKVIVEPVCGWIKQVLGFRSFSLRGLDKVRSEWALVCLALNLRRMNGRMQTC
jgi:IS5 family transposase